MEEHRAAMEYDWRHRFSMALKDVPTRMSWAEAYRLYTVLVRDPSSATAASHEGWDYTMSREAMTLADLYDLTHQIAAGKRSIKRYPRPWPDVDKTRPGRVYCIIMPTGR